MTNDAELTTPEWVADAVFYQIFPERFANGDPSLDPPGVEPWDATPTRENFFGGDLAGITEHLDHIERLGANTIYLTPIFEADTNHRYDAKDYFTVDHRLGDDAAFDRFLAEAHRRGIRVVLDAVLNHCGDGHWAFRDVVEHEAGSRYVNWFSVEGFPVRSHPEPNYRTCSGCYYLPKWNAYNPEVREHHFRVARHWLERGIDGWRLDVPYFINRTFWREFRTVVKSIDPEAYIVAEEWREPFEWLDGTLADGTMNYTFRDVVLGFTADRTVSAGEAAQRLDGLSERLPAAARPAMLNLLGSHDTERVLTRHGGDRAATLLAFSLLAAGEGAPMMYYGDEIGLEGDNDPLCRGTMPWDRSRWDDELLAHTTRMLRLRREERVLRRGAQRAIPLGDDALGLVRFDAERAVAVVVNRLDRPVPIPLDRLDESVPGLRGARWIALHPDSSEHTADGAPVAPSTGTVVLAKGGIS